MLKRAHRGFVTDQEANMEIDFAARLYVLEVLITQLISEHLRTAPDPDRRVEWVKDWLNRRFEFTPIATQSRRSSPAPYSHVDAHGRDSRHRAAANTMVGEVDSRSWLSSTERGVGMGVRALG
jgi:hypothetical protein